MYDFVGKNTESNSTASSVTSANEVVVRIFLLRGVHHYITCTDTDEVTWALLEDEEFYNQLAVLCLNIQK